MLAGAPPKSPGPEEAAVVDGVAAVFAAPPNRPDAELAPELPVLAKRLAPVGLGGSAGGAPAGVVDARENMGFAGVVAVVVARVVPGALTPLFPNKEVVAAP